MPKPGLRRSASGCERGKNRFSSGIVVKKTVVVVRNAGSGILDENCAAVQTKFHVENSTECHQPLWDKDLNKASRDMPATNI
jgi:hypothetical protein